MFSYSGVTYFEGGDHQVEYFDLVINLSKHDGSHSTVNEKFTGTMEAQLEAGPGKSVL